MVIAPPSSHSYPLVICYIAMEKSTIFHGKIHYKWPFSIAILVYRRVNPIKIPLNHHFPEGKPVVFLFTGPSWAEDWFPVSGRLHPARRADCSDDSWSYKARDGALWDLQTLFPLHNIYI